MGLRKKRPDMVMDVEWLKMIGCEGKDLFFVGVSGDSMMPTLGPNTRVAVDPSDKKPGGGGVFVVRVHEDLLVKELQHDPVKKTLTLKSHNESYDPIVIDLTDEAIDFDILGRVVSWLSA